MRLFYMLIRSAALCTLASCSGGGGTTPPTAAPTPTPPSNSAPVVANPNDDLAVLMGSEISYDASKSGAAFSDADGDALTYSLSLNPALAGVTTSGPEIGGIPTETGTIAVTVSASDPSGAVAQDVFEVTISPRLGVQQPNILLIILDDWGQDASAQYSLSNDLPSTPNIDALAGQGLVFENLWVNPTCSPTRATIISGEYGERTGVLTPGDPLPAGGTILQAFLDQMPETRTYETALIGKWHLGGGAFGPNNAGLDHFAGIVGGGIGDYFDWTLTVNGAQSQSSNYATSELTDQAINWLNGRTEPWFLWLSYNAPHTPFHLPPASLHGRTLSGMQADINANPRPYFLAAIEAMDAELGRLLGNMNQQARENTTIIIIGDNGAPGQVRDQATFPAGAKGSLFEGGVRVPLIASGAGVARSGEREEALLNGVDLFITIAELAGLGQIEHLDSRSFAGLLSGPSDFVRDTLYTESGDGFALRNDQYKLIETYTGTQALFDLKADPTEQSDLLSAGADVSAVLAELEAARDAIR